MRKKKRIGMFVGKFLPPHLGHLNQILECSAQCDKLFVVVADSTERSKQLCKNASIPTIFPKRRYQWLKNYFKTYKNIKVKFLNQGMLEAFPDTKNWVKKINHITHHLVRVWFVDKNYEELSHKVFPEFEFVGFNRNKINIRAENIRNNLALSKTYLPKEALDFVKNFTKNV